MAQERWRAFQPGFPRKRFSVTKVCDACTYARVVGAVEGMATASSAARKPGFNLAHPGSAAYTGEIAVIDFGGALCAGAQLFTVTTARVPPCDLASARCSSLPSFVWPRRSLRGADRFSG